MWFRSTYKKLMQTTRDKLAKQAGLSSSDNLVLLENASAAVNAIFRSLALNPGDIFVYLSSAYGMVKHTAAWLNVSEGIRILEVAITVPISSNESFLEPLRAALTALMPEERARVKIGERCRGARQEAEKASTSNLHGHILCASLCSS